MSEKKEKASDILMAQAIEPNVPTTSGATTNYGLPQWEGGDVTNWFELNPAFSKIDEVMKANADGVETAQSQGNSNTAAIANLTESLNNTISRVTSAENINTQQTQQITLNTTHLNEHDTAIQANNAAIESLQSEGTEQGGDIASLQADVSTLQGQLTTAQYNIATNADHIGDLSGLITTAKKNLVNAVNEIASKQSGGGSAFYEGQYIIIKSSDDFLSSTLTTPKDLDWNIGRRTGGNVAIYASTTCRLENLGIDRNLANFISDIKSEGVLPQRTNVYLVGILTNKTYMYDGYYALRTSPYIYTMGKELPHYMPINNPYKFSTEVTAGDTIPNVSFNFSVPLLNMNDDVITSEMITQNNAHIKRLYNVENTNSALSYVLVIAR